MSFNCNGESNEKNILKKTQGFIKKQIKRTIGMGNREK